MKNKELIYSWNFQNITYRFEMVPTSDFSKLDKVTQVSALVLNKNNQILLVTKDNKNWALLGGKIESGESYEEALVREVYEESAAKIDETTIKPIFYQDIYEKPLGVDDDQYIFHARQLRYVCNMERQEKFYADPGGNVIDHVWVDVESLNDYLDWGEEVVGFMVSHLDL